jgi:hypothetical protein
MAKKIKKRKGKVDKRLIIAGMWSQKLNTLVETSFASKVAMSQQALEFRVVIHVCYSQQILV